jgi:hypothetical protein
MNTKERAISWYNVDEHKYSSMYNNKNLHTYDPYYQEGDKLLIDTDWWDTLIPFARNLVRDRIGTDNIEFCYVEIPHPPGGSGLLDDVSLEKPEKSDGKLAKEVYYAYLESFDYNFWYHDEIKNGPKNVCMIYLNPIKDVLQKITRKRIITGSTMSAEDLSDLSGLSEQITDYFSSKIPVFARLSSTSGKNEIPLEPLNSAADVLQFMTNNRLFLNQEYNIDTKDSYLIMMPWNEINERYEFRIFVYDGRLTGISQQKWFGLFQYSDEELEAIKETMKTLPFLDDVPYKNLVADVWIDVQKRECYLIECNPFGAHSGSGSSLFSWIDDYDQLHGKNEWAEFRYTSLVI